MAHSTIFFLQTRTEISWLQQKEKKTYLPDVKFSFYPLRVHITEEPLQCKL